jgi:hypothetical protein
MAEDGFLQRWSRRKASLGASVPDGPPNTHPAQPPKAAPAIGGVQAPDALISKGGPQSLNTPPSALAPAPGMAQPSETHTDPQPAPSLADTEALTPASDFRPFMGQGVAPEVKNAAMKKLFADPHFNVMDRMDIYIDDYSQPDPLPLAMLRQMNGAKFLNLFEDEDEDKDKEQAALTPAPAEGAMQTPVSPMTDSVEMPASAHTPPMEAPLSAQAPGVPDASDDSNASPRPMGDTGPPATTLPVPKA